jgi:hypothetical protein
MAGNLTRSIFRGGAGLGSFPEPISGWNFLPLRMLRIQRISALK